MIFKHKYLIPLSILLGSIAGIGSSISNTEKEVKIIEELSPRNPDPETKIPEQERAQEDTVKPKEEKKYLPPQREEKIKEVKEEKVLNGRLRTDSEIIERETEDSKFSEKVGELSYKDGIRTFGKEEQQKARKKFEEYQVKISTSGKWKLIDYDDHKSWRYKTVDFMRSDLKSPIDWTNETDNGETDINTEDGKEKLASKLRERCYEAAEYMEDKDKLEKKFSSRTSEFDGTEVLNLCTFIDTQE